MMAKWELVKLIRNLTGDRKSLSVHVDNENPIEVQLKGGKALGGVAVVPDDNNDLPHGVTAGLYVGQSGRVTVTLADGSVVTFVNLASGGIHPIAAKRVHATDTDAQNIVAVY